MTNQEAIDFIEREQIFTHLEADDCDLCKAWQTLKTAALAQQPNNSAMPKCRCGNCRTEVISMVKCINCGGVVDSTSA